MKRLTNYLITVLLLTAGLLALTACSGPLQETDESDSGLTTPAAAETNTEDAATTAPAAPETDSPTPADAEPAPTETVPEPLSVRNNPIEPLQVQFFEGVISADVEAADNGTVYVALGRQNGVIVRSSSDSGATFSNPVVASQGRPLLAQNIERPSIAVNDHGQVGLVWLDGPPDIKVWHALSADGGATFSDPQLIDKNEADGLWLPRITVDENFQPYFAWIEGGTLVFAHSENNGEDYTTATVDDLVCECCPPDPVVIGDRMFIAYRDSAMDDQDRWYRDIHVASAPMGSFADWREVSVSDAPWLIDVCPLSGPTLVEDGERLFVFWMDGRNDEPNSFNMSDIWLAVSHDGGETFSENRQLNTVPGAYNNKPVAAVGPDSRLHVAWQAEEGDRGVLYYTYSDDGGETFATLFEVTVNIRGEGNGVPGNAQISVGPDGHVYLLWVDRNGAYLWSW